jgi:hypothetical protein
MSQHQTRRNHYVPQWYQRRFLPPGVDRFFYLDLKPEAIRTAPGRTVSRKAILRWGPARCFYQDDLYTMKLGRWSTDAVERRFFGPIDNEGKAAVEFFSEYQFSSEAHDRFEPLMRYMDAQRLRTPQGLDWLKLITRSSDQNSALRMLSPVYQMHSTMWTEGVWEIARADRSKVKFLLTDRPITFYNPRVFPASPNIPYPHDADLRHLGTRTLFPLSLDRCLVITHLQLVRDPWLNPVRPRTNARSYSTAIFHLEDVQTERNLTEDEVLRINFNLKRRATRYLAAAEEEWLYPERHVSTDHWSKLNDDWFLFPNLYKVSFSSGIVAGWDDGRSWAADEYGRRPSHPRYQDKDQHAIEWRTALKGKQAWLLKRARMSVSRTQNSRFNDAEDRIMERDLLEHERTRSKSHR